MLLSRSLLASLLVCMIPSGLAYAQGAHYGSADPQTEGWTLQTTAGGTGVAIDPDPDFPDVSSWEAVSNGLLNYRVAGPADGTDWTMRALLRVPDLAKPVNYDVALLVADSVSRRWVLSFGTTANGDTIIDPEEAAAVTVPASQAGRSDYVLIEMAGAANLMDVFVNGVEMASDVPHRVSTNNSDATFGDQTSFAQQRGRYALVEYIPGPQTCRDGIDNDNDGLVDFAGGDPDCSQPNDPSEDSFDLVLPSVSIGALTYNPDLDDEIIYDTRNSREWLRWNVLLSGGGFLSYADVIDAITTGAYSGQGWTIGRNADGLAFVDAALDGQTHGCGVTGNFNNCGIPAGDFNAVVGDNCTGNETVAFLLSDNGEGSEAGVLDLVSDIDRLLFHNEWGSIAQTDVFTCGGFGGTWLIYRDAEMPPDGIVGSWSFFEEAQPGAAGGPVVLTLLANGQYLHGQDGDPVADPNGEDGLEWGTYVYDGSTISFTALLDTNGGWGPDGAVLPLTLNGNQLLLGPPGDETALQRIYSTTLAGAWLFDYARDDQSIVLNLLLDGTFMLIHGNNDDPCGCGQAGIEYGTYDWDSQSGAISFTIATDTNGEFGVSSDGVSSDISTVTIAGNQLTATVEGEGAFTFTRISAADDDSDGLANLHDNCMAVANAGQLDTDADGIGNLCDADIAPLPNDCAVNFADLSGMKTAFFSNPASSTWNPDADFDGNNIVNFADLERMKASFFGTPGPSGEPNDCQ